MKPVAVSSSSLESAVAIAAAAPNAALALDHFDFDDFTTDAAGAPFASITPDVLPSHSGSDAAASAAAAASNESFASAAQTNTVPEFLYQLTKLLTDDNRDAIEWSHGKFIIIETFMTRRGLSKFLFQNLSISCLFSHTYQYSLYKFTGQIEVHNPHKLESDVLKKYFRHSKYASFQRQLNYFGFRKLAGKGKMAPCSYTNDHTTPDIRCLLSIKVGAVKYPILNGVKQSPSYNPHLIHSYN
jgi:hypothetical protein